MSVTADYFLSLSRFYLRAMIGDSQVWRALVAQPDTDWDSLKTLIDAATSPQVAALAKIVSGRFEDDTEHADYKTRPRCCIRNFDETVAGRASTTGFANAGLTYVAFEIPIPTTYQASGGDAYEDAENKIGGIIQEMAGMGRIAGYLDVSEIILTSFGQMDPDSDNGELYYVAELAVHHKGSVLP